MNNVLERADGELTFGALLEVITRNLRVVIAAMVIGLAISIVLVLREPVTYTTITSFIPQKQSATGGIAAQLGLGVSSADAMQSSPFYAELVTSHAILGEVVDSGRVRTPTGEQTIAQALGISTDGSNWRNDAIGAVRDMVSPEVTTRTQVITLQVSGPTPDVAVAVANAVVAALTRFNSEVRQSAAAAERRFIDARRAEVKADLTATEDRFQAFLRRNRGGLDSPELDFERQRLLTEVSLRRDMYSTLSQAYERARMDEVRDTPVITVIDRPQRPMGPDPRNIFQYAVLALFGGALAGVVLAFLLEAVQRARATRFAARAP